MSQDRPPRCRPLPPDVVARVATRESGVADAELLERVEQALLSLPDEERTAVVASVMYADGVSAVAAELDVTPARAEALTREGLQHMRVELEGLDIGEHHAFGVLSRRPVSEPDSQEFDECRGVSQIPGQPG